MFLQYSQNELPLKIILVKRSFVIFFAAMVNFSRVLAFSALHPFWPSTGTIENLHMQPYPFLCRLWVAHSSAIAPSIRLHEDQNCFGP